MSRANLGSLFVHRWIGPLALGIGAMALASLSPRIAVAQARPAAGNQPAEKKIVDPEDVDLETKDKDGAQVQLQLTYYASNVGKDAVPVILLHGWKGSRADLQGLALQLQARGYAVIVPDLRGHGKSTQYKQNGQTYSIDPNTMKRDDFLRMSDYDLETVKSFIKDKNNAQELNMEKLCVAGYEMGAIVAARWAHKDWNWPHLLTGKQGEDVKALIVIAPMANFKGLNLMGADALGSPHLQNDDIAVMFLAGGTNPKPDEVERMYKKMVHLPGRARFNPNDKNDEAAKATVFRLLVPNTTLQTANLLAVPNISSALDADMAWLIDNRVANKKTPWAARK